MARESIFPASDEVIAKAGLEADKVDAAKAAYERAVDGWVNQPQTATMQDVNDIRGAANLLVIAKYLDEASSMSARVMPAMRLAMQQDQRPGEDQSAGLPRSADVGGR